MFKQIGQKKIQFRKLFFIKSAILFNLQNTLILKVKVRANHLQNLPPTIAYFFLSLRWTHDEINIQLVHQIFVVYFQALVKKYYKIKMITFSYFPKTMCKNS